AAAPSAIGRPLRLAVYAALLGAALLVLVGGVAASTFGLLFVAGATGAVIGLVLARAAVPGEDEPGTPVPRSRLKRLAVGLALGAVAVGAAGTWVVALLEGGVLGPIDYLLTTFGPFLPAEAILAALGAWWGVGSGPIQG
ncbi:MAG TPA: hypothetical protein VNL94_03035, partial [Candidatus Binatia bacterium]|nr:hypothetical protein [Candidatus Binatia bacterium]